ncbi:MAG: hypothetical protein RLZZ15_632 [Verrucomicrobiota bacterium]|jgi:hypothetical protein
MPHHLRRALAFFLLPFAASLAAKPTAPDWLVRAAATPAPATFDKKTKAVVLHREITFDVRDDGVITTTERIAVRMLQPEGYKHARASANYHADTDKVRTTLAWLVPPQGDVIPYVKKDFAEITLGGNALYTDARSLHVSASGNAVTGAVFGSEITIESRSIFSQLLDTLQGPLPILAQLVAVRLPRAWEVSATFINHPGVAAAPAANGLRTWSLPALPALPDEPAMPGARRLTALLGLDLLAPAGAATREKLVPRFTSWTDVSLYFSPLNDAACLTDAAVTAKAAELTAGATTPLAVLRALARFAQQVNYAAVSANLGRGGGYQPRPAPVVLQRNFGDCKDKATLLRALLRVQGIAAYPVSIYSGDARALWPEWPSPYQFNHAILAIAAPADLASPAIVAHPKLGRLLLFDPTDEHVPLGELPRSHYGSQVLLEAGADGGLLTLPPLPAASSRVHRTLAAAIDDAGALTAHLTETNHGHDAVLERDDKKSQTPDDYQKGTALWISSAVRNAKISNLKTADRFEENQFSIDLDLAAPAYAQSLRGKLLIFKPALLTRRRSTSFTEETRTQPILFRPHRLDDTATIKLPPSFTVDELPKPVELTTAFARYRTSCTAADGMLTATRHLEFFAAEIPATDYAAVKKFFEQVIKADQAAAVLQRRPTPPAAAAGPP